jgi:hypothetical protein
MAYPNSTYNLEHPNFFEKTFGGGLKEQGTRTIQLGAEEGRQPGREGCHSLEKVPVMTDRDRSN